MNSNLVDCAPDAGDHLLLHRAKDKEARYKNAPPLHWSHSLNCWLTSDPATMNAVQQSTLFHAVDHKGQTERIRERLGLDLGNIERAMQALPVGVEGDEHAQRRRRMAKALADKAESGLGLFAALAEKRCRELLWEKGERELMSALFEPLGLAMASELSGLTLKHQDGYLMPVQMFDRFLGLGRRKRIDALLGDLFQQAEQGRTKEAQADAVSLAILGSESIVATLAISFIERVEANPGARLSEIDWGQRLTRTSVPFVERMATQLTTLAGTEIQAGQIVRFYLDRYSFEAPEERDALFGTGRHSCLGRALSQRAWRKLAEALGQSRQRLSLEKIEWRETDCMFLSPTFLQVRLYGSE